MVVVAPTFIAGVPEDALASGAPLVITPMRPIATTASPPAAAAAVLTRIPCTCFSAM